MIEKLKIIKQRFDEVNDLIIQPEIISDQKRYIKLNKEYKELKLLVDLSDQYLSVVSNINEAESIIKESDDSEMVEIAKIQLEESKLVLDPLSDRIKLLLIPKDPEDSKNVVIEIRQSVAPNGFG